MIVIEILQSHCAMHHYRKLYEKVHSTRKSLELLIEQKMERIRVSVSHDHATQISEYIYSCFVQRGHENDVNLVTKQEKALHVLKVMKTAL